LAQGCTDALAFGLKAQPVGVFHCQNLGNVFRKDGAAIAYLSAGLRKMTNWLRKGSDTLKRSDQFKERCPSLDVYV
jgi:hypothetical protein